MRVRSPNLLLVCLLALTTLWLSETAASHIHLDNDNVSCEICHSSNSGDATLQSSPVASLIISTTTVPAPALSAHPASPVAAPLNSRAPPSLI